MHSIIEQMNKTFLRFHDATLKSGLLQLNPGLARELKLATETFTNLAKTATEFETGDEDGEVDGEVARPPQRPQPATSPAQEHVHLAWGYSVSPDRSGRTETQHIQTQTQPDNFFSTFNNGSFSNSLMSRRQLMVGEVFDQPRTSSSYPQPTPTTSQHQAQLPFGLVDLLGQPQNSYTSTNPHIYSVNIPTPDVSPPTTRLTTPPLHLPPITRGLAPAFTYSHDETNFARRLTRAALESAFQLLSSVNSRSSAINYIFKLSLPYLTLDQMRARFKMMLARSVDEELDFWETPFVHLGGAGTHYPQKDPNGNVVMKKNNWTIRQIGSAEKRTARMENMADGKWRDVHDIDLTLFEGEWFDSWDVQGYLEDHYDCRLDPKSSFAECTIEEREELDSSRRSSDDSPSLTHSTTNSSIASSASSGECHSSISWSWSNTHHFQNSPRHLNMPYTASAHLNSHLPYVILLTTVQIFHRRATRTTYPMHPGA